MTVNSQASLLLSCIPRLFASLLVLSVGFEPNPNQLLPDGGRHANYHQSSIIISRGVMRSAASSCMQQCVWWLVRARVRHSVRMTHRPSAALRLLGSLRISHNKFLRANK